MDADILRLILVVLGGLLILGIYLWDRRKRINGRIQAIRSARKEARREPRLGGAGPRADGPAEREAAADPELEDALHTLGDLVSAEGRETVRAKQGGREKPRRPPVSASVEARQQDLFADEAVVDTDHYKHADPSIPAMILQINIVSRAGGFPGPDLLRVVQGVELEPGDMQIFHRHDGKGGGRRPVLFSMASMVEPGTFPLQALEGFTTPGVTLFAQLPGPRDGLAIFSDMLFTAERIAAELNGELQDETHSRLTKQTIEHLRSEILEHRRRVQLAKSKLK